MLGNTTLIETLNKEPLSRRDALILILSSDDNEPKSVTKIKEIANSSGFRKINKWNVSDILSSLTGIATRLDSGWVLTQTGVMFANELMNAESPRIKNVAKDLRALVSQVSDETTRDFLDEAAACFEFGSLRAAVVLSWVGAVSVLQSYVLKHVLDEFNNEALKRNPKWTRAKSADDLSRLKERDFLDILCSISVIGKSVKQELEGSLILRNGCGHPNSLKIGKNRVASHIESLILNVYQQFS